MSGPIERKISARGSDRPALKLLNKYVRKDAAVKWHDLGLELLEQEDEGTLNEIQINNPNNASECCKLMFQLWLSKRSDATWDLLINALREPNIELNNLATTIENLLVPVEDMRENMICPSTENGSDEIEMEVDFSAYKDVSNAFVQLFSVCQKAIKVSKENFRTIRNSCVARASEPLRGLIKRATDTPCLFEILGENDKYCNWMDVRLLIVIAIACGNKQLQSLIENYMNVIYSKPLREVWNNIPHYSSVKDRYYSELKVTFGDKNPDDVTVEELIRSKPQLAKEIAIHIGVVQEKCLVVTWLIPTDKLYQAYLSFLTFPHQLRKDDLIQFDTWMAYLPQNVLQKYEKEIDCGAVSIPTLLIGYYHGLLLRDINADLLTDKMCSTELLTDDKQALISSGHTVHHRNWMLLEHVRHMDPKVLLEFCRLALEEWPEIGSQLITALNAKSKSQKFLQPTTSVISKCQCDDRDTIKGSVVLTLYLHLIDQLGELLQSYNYTMMMEQCTSLMASDHNDIKLFSNDQLRTFSQYDSAMLLRKLCIFSWSNCSILRTLISCSNEGIKLLDKFEFGLDPSELIALYPISCFSTDMIPSDTSTYTILAVRCKVELYESSLQYIYDIQLVMIEKCDITQHCLQLLAVRSDPTILYWTIPKCVVDLINTTVPLRSEYLYSRGILEVLVYPDLLFTTGYNVCYGSLAFKCGDQLFSEEVYLQQLEEMKLNIKLLRRENFKLKQQLDELDNKQVAEQHKKFEEKAIQIDMTWQKELVETKLSSNLSHEKVDELQSELYIAHKQLEQQKKIVAKYRELKAKEKDSDVDAFGLVEEDSGMPPKKRVKMEAVEPLESSPDNKEEYQEQFDEIKQKHDFLLEENAELQSQLEQSKVEKYKEFKDKKWDDVATQTEMQPEISEDTPGKSRKLHQTTATAVTKRSVTDLFGHYYAALVSLLPFNDTDFMGELLEHGLLPGDVESKLESLTVHNERSSYFLDNVIKPGLVVGNNSHFVSLITIMKGNKHDNVKALATKIEKDLDIYIKYLSKPLLKDLHNIVVPKISNVWYEIGIQLLTESHLPRLDEIRFTYLKDYQRGCLEMLKFWLQNTPQPTWNNLICVLRAPGLELSLADDVEKEFKATATAVTKRSVTDLFGHYYAALVSLLPFNDTDFMGELLKHGLLPGNVKSKLESLTVHNERSSYFLDNVIKPGLVVGNNSHFVSLITIMKGNKHDNVKALAIIIEKDLDIYIKYLSKPLLKDLHNIVVPRISNVWFEIGIQLLTELHLPRLDEIRFTYVRDYQRGCLEMLKFWLQNTPQPTWNNLICVLRAPGLELSFIADDIEKEFKVLYDVTEKFAETTAGTAVTKSSTELYKRYYVALTLLLPFNDANFMDKLLKHDLLPGDVKSKLESLTVHNERSSYFLDNVIKPALVVGNNSHFVSLITIMKVSEHDNVKDLATMIEKDLDVDKRYLSKPRLNDLEIIVVPKISNKWYEIGIQLFTESHLPRLDEIRLTYSNDHQSCINMLRLWLEITPGATWDDVIHALRAPGLELLSTADDVEKEFRATLFCDGADHRVACIEGFEDDDVTAAFAYLFNKLGVLFSEVNFIRLKNACIQRGSPLPSEFKQQIRYAVDLDDLLDVLDNPMYCNWLNIHLLKRIVRSLDIPEAKHLIQAYERSVYSRKVSEVEKYFHSDYFKPSHVSLVNAKIVRSFGNLTVADIIKYCESLESNMGVYAGSVTATECTPGCLQLTCVIPIHLALHAYETTKTNFLKFRQAHIQYIKIETFPKVFALKFSIQDYNLDKLISASDTSQVINHHYTSLENYMDADSVSHMMHCEHLITDDDYEAITAAPNDSKMNTLLLQYVRPMNVNQLSRFCDILGSIKAHQIIGDCSSTCFFQALLQKLSTNVRVSISRQSMASSIEYMKISEVNMIFYDLIDYLYLHLSAKEKMSFDLIGKCGDVNPLLTKQWFKKIKSLYLFKIYLLPFITWLDHSILKELVVASGSEDAQHLLYLFGSKICSYSNQPITSFPIPSPNQLIIPLHDSEYTLLAMKFCPPQGDAMQGMITLQDVLDIKLLMKHKWELNSHDTSNIQLVAVHKKLKLLYWMIPKCLEKVIKNNLIHDWKSGVITMDVLPANFHSLEDNSKALNGLFSSLKFIWRDDTEQPTLSEDVPEILDKSRSQNNLNPNCILDINSNDNIIWNGRIGKGFHGHMHSVTPIYLTMNMNEEDSQIKSFEALLRMFQVEVAYLQKAKLLCLLGMKGEYKYPNTAVVMKGGTSSLYSYLLEEFNSVSIPDSELYHSRILIKKHCGNSPTGSPGLQEIVEQMCDLSDQILFVKSTNLEFDQDMKGVTFNNWLVEMVLLSPAEGIVWTIHTNGQSIAQKQKLNCVFNSHKVLNKKIDQQKRSIGFGSVPISGYALIIIMKSHNQMVEVLVCIRVKHNANTVMIRVEKEYQIEKQSMVTNQKYFGWKIISAQCMLQMTYLSTGNSWMNDSSVNEVSKLNFG